MAFDVEWLITVLCQGFGLIGDACTYVITAILSAAFKTTVPPWVGRVTLLCTTALLLWSLQKRLPKVILIGCVIMAVVMIFGSYVNLA
jgi:hypothetical protein